MPKILIFLSLVFVLLYLSLQPLNAHGTSQSFPKDSGEYTIELEYDAAGVFDDTTTPFIFRILDRQTKESIKFDSALIRFERVSDKSTTIVAKVVPDELQDGVGRLTAMLNSGDYKVSVIFYGSSKELDKSQKIAEVEYDLKVEKGESSKNFPTQIVLSVAIGIAAGFLLSRFIKVSNGKK